MSRSTAAPLPRLLTVAQAAEHLGTTTSNLYELVARHAIPSVRIGRAIRIPQDALDRPAARPAQAEPDARTSDLDRPASDTGETESEMHPTEFARTNRLPTDPREQHAELDRSADQRSSSPTHWRPTTDVVPMPEHSHGERRPSEPRQPNSREAASWHTDLHPRATRPRVDAESPREAQP